MAASSAIPALVCIWMCVIFLITTGVWTCYAFEEQKIHLYDNVILPKASKSATFVVTGNFSQTALDFKGSDRASNVALSPQIDHFKDFHQGPDSTLIFREMKNFPSIQHYSNPKPKRVEVEPAISRPFGIVKSEKSFSSNAVRKQSKERYENIWLQHTPEVALNHKMSRSRGRPKNLQGKLPHEITKRSIPNELSENTMGERITRGHRIPKMRIAGSKTSKYGPKSTQYCPALPVSTRNIVRCSNGRKVGSKCSLSCASGFVIAGKRKTRKCRTRRYRRKRRKHFYHHSIPYWTGKQQDFQCVPVCKHLNVPLHGDRTCKMIDLPRGRALRCTTQCDNGYKLVGSSYNTCMEKGIWSGQPAVCKAASTRQTQKIRFKFREHQTLPCGEVYGLASFRKNGVVYLVAGDKSGNEVKIFRWGDEGFVDTPFQTFHYSSPEIVEILTAPDGRVWLMVGGAGPVTMFRLGEDNRFRRSHTTQLFDQTRHGDTIGFAELQGEFYRCYGRNRRETPVIVVHKLQDKPTPGGGDVFRRIMRKKLPGERVHQCSMYTEGNSLYTVATLNKPDGQGRIMIGHLTRNRMKIVDVISGKQLKEVSDSFGFTIDGGRYIAVSQSTENGKCLIYKRQWRNSKPVETG
uniref:uncharacterized protein LOC120328953 n=1 Tax=Styela clava TaxID=7725 RepID=UPI00193A653C|nr:uncharacterized protein LOC120328953 [Styela clava]